MSKHPEEIQPENSMATGRQNILQMCFECICNKLKIEVQKPEAIISNILKEKKLCFPFIFSVSQLIKFISLIPTKMIRI